MTNQTLLTLDLTGNKLGDGGARAFAEALCGGARLTALHLGDNKLSAVAGGALADALACTTRLRRLEVWHGGNTSPAPTVRSSAAAASVGGAALLVSSPSPGVRAVRAMCRCRAVWFASGGGGDELLHRERSSALRKRIDATSPRAS